MKPRDSCEPSRMSRGNVRARLRAAGEMRFLTDGEAAALLTAEKMVDEPLSWEEQSERYVRTQVAVVNSLGEYLYLTGKVNRRRPGASSWALVWGRKVALEHPESIRRLDLRGRHRNPDGELWHDRTHKHRWSAADNNSWAYTPDDIPHEIPGSVVGVDNYREVFEAFAAECGVSLGDGYEWSDPPLEDATEQTGLWEP